MKIKKNRKIIGLVILTTFSLSLVPNMNNVSAFYNWVEWEGTVTNEWGNNYPVSGATVRLKRGSTTLDTDITDGNGYYFIREYVDTIDYLTLHVSKTNYTSTSIHVLARDIGEPWEYDFTINYVKTYAVIVGLNTYDDNSFDNLLYCENDADDWNDHLSNSTGLNFDNIEQYEDSTSDHDGQATEKTVTDALSDVVADTDGGDIIAFIFSGHGDDGSGDEYSLCMWDAENGQNGEDGYLNHTELADIFDGCKAERIFFFFDSCHSYGMKNALENHIISDNYLIAAAANEAETAYEDHTNENGCWTHCFLEYAWYIDNNYSINTSFDDIFYDGYVRYRYLSIYPTPIPDDYNDNTYPKKTNGYGEDFCLSKYGITPT